MGVGMTRGRFATTRLARAGPVLTVDPVAPPIVAGRIATRGRFGTTRLARAGPVLTVAPIVPPVVLPPDLLTAVWIMLAGDAGLEAAFGRAAGGKKGWLQWPDGRADLPVVTLATIDLSGTPRRTFPGMTLRTTRLVVSVHATPKGRCQALGKAVRRALAPEPGYVRLAYGDSDVNGREIPGGRIDRTLPGGPETLPERDRQGRTVFLYRVLFDLQLREWPATGA
jgi:hypothetical protein